MSTQPEALRLSECLERRGYASLTMGTRLVDREIADELRRLHQHELANNLWHEKTNWVQESVKPVELGMHRADVLRERISHLYAEVERLEKANRWLRVENEALRADAERYRYLRNRNPQEILPVIGPAAGVWIDCDDEDGELTLLTGEDADAAIDVARSKT